MKKQLSFLALALALVAAPACKKDPVVVEPTPQPKVEPKSGPVTTGKKRDPNRFKNIKPIDLTVDTPASIELQEGIVVLFETGSDKILTESLSILDEVAIVMSEAPAVKIRVEGHTDDVGDDKKNLDLSKRRAASVKTYIESKGIAADRVSSEGCGETAPIADNKTAEGKTKNRRVVFVVLKTGSETVCQAL
jgi:outer membrane protein OmpA-like peptidoglycan-associated protein